MDPTLPGRRPPSKDSRVGEVLGGKYRLEELLGSGGMGDVYRAVNQLVGRTVAIKTLRTEHAENQQIIERFLREARAANLVRHKNVVDVLDIGQDDCGVPFIVQELLRGEDLSKYAARLGGRVPLEQVIEILCPVVDAVAEAHAQGVVHRDIKPENVFIVRSEVGIGVIPKLLDFGISKVTTPNVRATEVGQMLGTPAYMSPEQVQGSRDLDSRTDVWAIGIMLFELLAGRLPFDAADAPALFVAIVTKDAPLLTEVAPEIPPDVSKLVARCLRRKPDERYPSAAELARDLRHVLDGTELEATGKRSIPPSLMALVPDLRLPKAPGTPRVAPVEVADRRVHGEKIPTGIAQAAKSALEKPAPAAEVPSLAPLPPKSAPKAAVASPPPPKSAPKAAAARPAPPRSAPQAPPAPRSVPRRGSRSASSPALETTPLAVQPRSRLSPDAAMPGVGLAPGAPANTRAASSRMARATSGGQDATAWIVGASIAGIAGLFAFGALMRLLHRGEGWPIASFITRPNPALNLAIQGGLGLIAFAMCVTYLVRGVKHWKGELAGGVAGTIVGGLGSGAAAFVAVELFSAAW